MIIPDCHFPWHDKKLWKILLQIAAAIGLYGIIVLGDFGDNYCIMTHAKIPYRSRGLKWENEQVNDLGLDPLDALGCKEKIFIMGNHEYRLERYLMENAEELWGMVSVEEAYYLKQRGWKVIPYKQHVKVGNAYFTHDIGKAGEMAHKNAMMTFERTVGIGHTHQFGMWHKNDIDGTPRFGFHFGWLGDPNEAEYMHDAKRKRDWQHGFGIGYELSDGTMHIDAIPFIGGKCRVEGKIYG